MKSYFNRRFRLLAGAAVCRWEGNMLKEMKSYCHLKPGQDGTKRLVAEYGDRLLCVRYRFDATRGVKIKTVELIVDERSLTRPRFRDDDLVPVRVGYDESALREQLRGLRARWDGERKLWYVRYGGIKGTPLEERLVELGEYYQYR